MNTGLNSGDRVAIAMRNRPEWLIAFVAIINAGGVAVPLNSWGKSAELNQGLEDSDASLLICDPQRSQLVREINSDITQLVADFADGIDNARSLDTILAISKESPNTECDLATGHRTDRPLHFDVYFGHIGKTQRRVAVPPSLLPGTHEPRICGRSYLHDQSGDGV